MDKTQEEQEIEKKISQYQNRQTKSAPKNTGPERTG